MAPVAMVVMVASGRDMDMAHVALARVEGLALKAALDIVYPTGATQWLRRWNARSQTRLRQTLDRAKQLDAELGAHQARMENTGKPWRDDAAAAQKRSD
jgi:hypothetical protein